MPERIVRPGILTSDPVNLLSWAEEVFYRRLMSVVDDYGRFDGRNSILRANLYPLKLNHVSDSDVGKWKLATAEAGLVRVYFVDGKEFVEVRKFDQRMRGKPRWPAPPDGDSPQPAASRGDVPPSSETETEAQTKESASHSSPPASGGGPPPKPRSLHHDRDEEIYQAYPRHEAKQDALKAIAKARKALYRRGILHPGEWLLERVKAYAKARAAVHALDESQAQWTPLPATWFNKGRYDDDPAAWSRVYGDDHRAAPRPADAKRAAIEKHLDALELETSHANGS